MTKHKIGEITFEEQLMYKVYWYDKENGVTTALCETRERAHTLARIIKSSNDTANVNCLLVEE
jgi:uncharacterized protein YcfL